MLGKPVAVVAELVAKFGQLNTVVQRLARTTVVVNRGLVGNAEGERLSG